MNMVIVLQSFGVTLLFVSFVVALLIAFKEQDHNAMAFSSLGIFSILLAIIVQSFSDWRFAILLSLIVIGLVLILFTDPTNSYALMHVGLRPEPFICS